jgi:hypothetical protein
MTEQVTIYPDATPGTYKAYKTIGGWVVNFVEDRNTIRPTDGGRVHKNRQNAYARVERLNHPVKHALKKHGMAEAEYLDGYIANAQDEQGEYGDQYSLTLRQGEMPPFETKFFASVEELEEYAKSELPQPLTWRAIKPEEI